jgi:hypothetical protein
VKRSHAIAAGWLVLACGSVSAQSPSPARRPVAAPGREEAWRVIDAYIVSNLQESLGLSDDQFVKLLPLVKKLQNDRRTLAQHRRESLQELRRTLESGGFTEAKVGEELRALKAIESQQPGTVQRDVDAIDATLTPLQQARFRVMEVEVETKIREMMNKVRAERRANRGPKGPGSAEPADLPPER